MSAHTLKVLGDTLAELAPLMEEAMRALDKPGTRALRRKIDGSFHFAVGSYGMLLREETCEDEWDALNLPRYRRATEVWPGRAAFDARKTMAAEGVQSPPAFGPLRLVVDNSPPRVAIQPAALGGAA